MLMKIDETMESGGGDSSDDSRGSSPLPSHVSHRPKSQFSPGPPDNNSPLGPPTSLAAHHMINSLAASTAAKNMTPGLLASLSALNAMSSAAAAASFHHHDFGGSNSSFGGERGLDRHSYGSPPAPMAPTNDPTANECKLVDYRGQKVAAFVINGDTMLCLPQAFELFLKHLVGGLHTVYTKLKRLDIVPLVCNVEQVRILRGLGAIQPGVNRCKLLSCKDFDVLYKDCTTARPGRPPKRTSVPLVPLSTHSSHSQFMAIKKHQLQNGDYGPYDNNHTNAELLRLEKSPLLANGYNHPPTQISQIPPMHLLPLGGGGSAAAAAAVAAHSALFSPSGIPHGLPHGHPRDCRSAPLSSLNVARSAATWENCRTVYEDFVKHFESRYATEDCSDSDEKSSQAANDGPTPDSFIIGNGMLSGGSPVLNLSKNTVDVVSESEDGGGGEDDEDYNGSESEQGHHRKQPNYGGDGRGKGEHIKSPSPTSHGHLDNPHPTHYAPPGGIGPDTELGLTSNENLLRNIQGLLKVAADNAKTQERRVNVEKSELKMEAMRQRELREQIEKELMEERNLRLYYEKRWKKERRFRKKLEDRDEDDGDSPRSRSGERNPPTNPDSPHTLPHHYAHKLNNNNDRVKRSISPGEVPKALSHGTNNGTTTNTSRDSSER